MRGVGLLCLMACVAMAAGSTTSVSVTIMATGKHTVDDAFLGFTTDWWLPWGPYGPQWGTGGILEVDLSNANLRTLAKSLTPATWRIGGTPEDTVVYEVGNPPECPVTKQGAYPGTKCLSMDRWKDIAEFVDATGVELMFGLSGWYGRASDGKSPMNITNAAQLLKLTAAAGYKVHGFEMSNEDNTGGTNKYIDPQVLGADFVRLRTELNSAWSHVPAEQRPILVGPDVVDSGRGWVPKFLKAAGDSINASTYHAYAADGHDPNLLQTLLNPEVLQGSHSAATAYLKAVADNHPGLAVYGGEIGPAFAGGRANVTNTFADGFWYLDHLGELAAQGVRRFFRSTFIGGDYELVNHKTYQPNPDYWIALLWTRTVGNIALPTTSSTDLLIAYSMCTPAASSASGQGRVTVLLGNLDQANSAAVDISHPFDVSSRSEYHLRGARGNVQATVSELATSSGGWQQLRLGADGSLPSLAPVTTAAGSTVSLGPLTYAFVVLEGATCKVA